MFPDIKDLTKDIIIKDMLINDMTPENFIVEQKRDSITGKNIITIKFDVGISLIPKENNNEEYVSDDNNEDWEDYDNEDWDGCECGTCEDCKKFNESLKKDEGIVKLTETIVDCFENNALNKICTKHGDMSINDIMKYKEDGKKDEIKEAKIKKTFWIYNFKERKEYDNIIKKIKTMIKKLIMKMTSIIKKCFGKNKTPKI